MSDALLFGQTNYSGTARTIGMGNAVTAVGSDIGSIGINPAGSAVAGYSQFTITPSLSMIRTASQFAPSYVYDGFNTASFGPRQDNARNRLLLPNIGFTLRIPSSGDKLSAASFGFASNMTNVFYDVACAGGINEGHSSIAGAFAQGANVNADGAGNMLDPHILGYRDIYASRYFWNYVMAYQAGMINYNYDDLGAPYYGSTERKSFDGQTYSYGVEEALRQNYNVRSNGTKNDILFNVGLDFSEKFYLGFNIGMPIINYSSSQIYSERAVNPEDFPVTPEYIDQYGNVVVDPETYFQHLKYRFDYSASMDGIYGKIGFIYLPVPFLRVGGAIQTCTLYTIEERWGVSGETKFANSFDPLSSTSPWSETGYQYRSPWSLNLGAALTVGHYGMISVDYEMTDFSMMKYSIIEDYDSDYTYTEDFIYGLDKVNRLNKIFCGVSEEWRLGVELKPIPSISLRAGYSIKTDPERYFEGDTDGYLNIDAAFYSDNFDFYEENFDILYGRKYYDRPVKTYSLGFGYASSGPFFMDFALRRTYFPYTYNSPYAAYHSFHDGVEDKDYTITAPQVRSKRSIVDAVLTLGWRF